MTMTEETKPMPKSLHTITVLQRLAQLAKRQGFAGRDDPEGCMAWAVAFLGYGNAADPHGLAAKALRAVA